MKKYEQFQMCLAEVSQIGGLHSYHTIFLATMILRKLRHPEEGLREITTKTMNTMQKRYSSGNPEEKTEEKMREISMEAVSKNSIEYGKTNLVAVSTSRCLDDLDMALEMATFPEEMAKKMQGENVKFVFEYLTKKVKERMEKFAD